MEEEGSAGLWILRGPYWPPQVASVTCQGPLSKGTSSALLCPQDKVPPGERFLLPSQAMGRTDSVHLPVGMGRVSPKGLS